MNLASERAKGQHGRDRIKTLICSGTPINPMSVPEESRAAEDPHRSHKGAIGDLQNRSERDADDVIASFSCTRSTAALGTTHVQSRHGAAKALAGSCNGLPAGQSRQWRAGAGEWPCSTSPAGRRQPAAAGRGRRRSGRGRRGSGAVWDRQHGAEPPAAARRQPRVGGGQQVVPPPARATGDAAQAPSLS